ncbi:19818_t:CDS:2, partial [Funneliformis geosporum]
TDAKLIHEISNHEFVKIRMTKGDLTRILGQNIAIVEGETHKRQRETMKPAFAHNLIKKRLTDDQLRLHTSNLRTFDEDKIYWSSNDSGLTKDAHDKTNIIDDSILEFEKSMLGCGEEIEYQD